MAWALSSICLGWLESILDSKWLFTIIWFCSSIRASLTCCSISMNIISASKTLCSLWTPVLAVEYVDDFFDLWSVENIWHICCLHRRWLRLLRLVSYLMERLVLKFFLTPNQNRVAKDNHCGDFCEHLRSIVVYCHRFQYFVRIQNFPELISCWFLSSTIELNQRRRRTNDGSSFTEFMLKIDYRTFDLFNVSQKNKLYLKVSTKT